MKHKGGLPPVFRKPTKEQRTAELKKVTQVLKQIKQAPRQEERSGISQLYVRPKSPFTAPGPSTAGRRRYKLRGTRKNLRRRS